MTNSKIEQIRQSITEHASLEHVAELITEVILDLPGVDGCAVLKQISLNIEVNDLYVLATNGNCSVERQTSSSNITDTNSENKKDKDKCLQIDLIHQDYNVGKLIINLVHELDDSSQNTIEELVFLASLSLAQSDTDKRLESYDNRLEVLNELNQLVTSDIGLERTIKTLARGVAFRFSCDAVLGLLLSSSGEELEIKGSVGCLDNLPDFVEVRNSFFDRLLRFGGIMSLTDLDSNDHGLPFLKSGGITCVHCVTIETAGRILGTIVIGYRNLTLFNDHDTAMLEEFARGAAVAIARAESREKLTAYTEELESLVQKRTGDLEVQTERAEEASRAKSHFVANMSHELRTPLTAIVAYSNVMGDGILGEINPKQKDALDAIFRSAQHLKELIDDVLDISKVEAGKTEPKPEAVSVSEMLTYVFKLMHQTAVGHEVNFLPYKPLPEHKDIQVFADQRQIRQALLNIVSNAIKYTPAGGKVEIKVDVGADKAKIMVTDSGVGISKEDASRLFERYERGDDSYSREQKGTGIGLSLTKHLVELNEGKIGVESQPGVGSTFWILLPLADLHPVVEDAVDLLSKKKALRCHLDGINVLVVDDNAMTCEVLDTIIGQVGGTAYLSQSVAQARDMLDVSSVDIALVDLAMPGENGLKLIKHIREHRNEMIAKLPIVVVSACVFESDKVEALESGASDFVAKPFQPQDLIQKIRNFTTEAALGLSLSADSISSEENNE